MRITGRIGTSPAERGSVGGQACPDILTLDTGDFLVIGEVPTAPHLLDRLDDIGAAIGEDEMAVVVPRQVLLAAARQLTARTETAS